MGKKSKSRLKKKQRRSKFLPENEPKPVAAAPRSHHADKRSRSDASSSVSPSCFPLPFPSGLPVPKNSFLCNTDPYKESFRSAIDSSYEGFAVDLQVPNVSEKTVQQTLLSLEAHGFFRTDVTQPFGLGTKCAKTYVTRCLLGQQGTTYKYLGLRMFSFPWSTTNCDGDNEKIHPGVHAIRELNQALTERTQHHLAELSQKRQARGSTVRGRVGFDICLVNRMTHSANLKTEPSLGRNKCAVSWHADSSLEHFSTIAVYQSIVNTSSSDKKHGSTPNDWAVALRVAHDAEGPNASRRGTDIQSTLIADTPTIAVSLPSGSAYFLLDDFNHHHQHAVVSQADSERRNSEVRYSCTHRLLRESHNVNFILDRCQKACSMFHKKGSKLWRSEQLLLTEIESEWIRQFYIQGQQHYDLLWKHWDDPMRRLLRYWGQLESRTEQTISLLQLAAEAKCGSDNSGVSPNSKKERKLRDKRKKALDVIGDLLSRSSTAVADAGQYLYQPMVDLLRERAEMRRLWKRRQEDTIFHELDSSQRPLPLPLEYLSTETNSGNEENPLYLLCRRILTRLPTACFHSEMPLFQVTLPTYR